MFNNISVELDEEWLELICTARELGLHMEEIRSFLQGRHNDEYQK